MLCVFSLPISLLIIVRIFLIRNQIGNMIISHCLWLSHEKMVCAVCSYGRADLSSPTHAHWVKWSTRFLISVNGRLACDRPFSCQRKQSRWRPVTRPRLYSSMLMALSRLLDWYGLPKFRNSVQIYWALFSLCNFGVSVWLLWKNVGYSSGLYRHAGWHGFSQSGVAIWDTPTDYFRRQ